MQADMPPAQFEQTGIDPHHFGGAMPERPVKDTTSACKVTPKIAHITRQIRVLVKAL